MIKTYSCDSCKSSFTHPDLLVTHTKARCKKSVYNKDEVALLDSSSSNTKPSNCDVSQCQLSNDAQLATSNNSNDDLCSSPQASKYSCLPTVLNVPKPQLALNVLSPNNGLSSPDKEKIPYSSFSLNSHASSDSTNVFSDDVTNTYSSENGVGISEEPINLKKRQDPSEDHRTVAVSSNKLLEALTKGKYPLSPNLPNDSDVTQSTANGNHPENEIVIKQESDPDLKSEDIEDDCKSLTTANVDNNPSTNFVHQILLNQLKMQQRNQQSHAIQKLTEFYLQQLQLVQRQKAQTIQVDNSVDGDEVSEIEESNGLHYGNLTIYPVRSKHKYEFNQPIDLSNKKANSLSDNSSQESKMDIFQSEDQHENEERSTEDSNDGEVEGAVNSTVNVQPNMLPLLLTSLLTQNDTKQRESSPEDPADQDSLSFAPPQEELDQENTHGNEEEGSQIKDRKVILNAMLANLLRKQGSEGGGEVSEEQPQREDSGWFVRCALNVSFYYSRE